MSTSRLKAVAWSLLIAVMLVNLVTGQERQSKKDEGLGKSSAEKSWSTLADWHQNVAAVRKCSSCHTSIDRNDPALASVLLNQALWHQVPALHSTQTRALIDHYYAPVAKEASISDYWIGIVSEPANDAYYLQSIRFHDSPVEVKSYIKGGLKITSVMEESPAKKAGLRKGDVIFMLGNQKIKTIKDLTQTISEKKGSKLRGILIRKNHFQPFSVTPEPRSEANEKNEKLPSVPTWNYLRKQLVDPSIKSTIPKGGRVVVEIDPENPVRVKLAFDDQSFTIEDADKDETPSPIRQWLSAFERNYHLTPRRVSTVHSLAFEAYQRAMSRQLSDEDYSMIGKDPRDEKLDKVLSKLKKLSHEIESLKSSIERK